MILDDISMKSTHTLLFGQLSWTFDITFELASNEDLKLSNYDDYEYNHIMIMAPSVNNWRSGEVSVERLLEIFDSGRNIYVALDETSQRAGRELFKEFGAELFPKKNVIRGGNRKSMGTNGNYHHSEVGWSSNIFSPIKETIAKVLYPVAYTGTGMKLDSENEHVFPILLGESTTYAMNPSPGRKSNNSKTFKVAGADITLMAGYQSRYNQRAVLSGSTTL